LAFVAQLLKKKPLERLGMPTCPAGEIRDHLYFKTIDWTLVEQRKLPPPFKPKIVSILCDLFSVHFLTRWSKFDQSIM